MKHIIKLAEPEELIAFKAEANDNWKPSYENLDSQVKIAIKKALIKEQGHICCYCERRVDEKYSHIEHYRPQHPYREFDLDYSNLHCSCFPDKVNVQPLHCGPAKDDVEGAKIHIDGIVSPLDSQCEAEFTYLFNGQIEAANGSIRASNTIKKLRLDCPRLNKMREMAIEPFIDDSLDPDEFRQFVQSYLLEGADGRFQEFHCTISHLFLG